MKLTFWIIALFFLCTNGISQNVGIGTNSPQAKLDINGGLRAGGTSKYLLYDSVTGKFTWNNSNLFVPSSQYLMQHSASAEGLFYGNNKLLYRGVNDTAFYTDWGTGNGYFRGNVGVGTTNPSAKLHVKSIGDEALRLDAYEPFLSLFSDGVYKGYLWKSPFFIELGSAVGSDLPITLAPNGTQRMFIGTNGNVGIGTLDPTASLEVLRGTGINGTAMFRGTQHLSHFNYSTNEDTYIRAGKDNGNVILNDVAGGKVGVGSTTPDEKLHVNGNIKADTIKPGAIRLTPNAGNGKVLTSDASGNARWQESNLSGSVGFGSWGDCSMNGVSGYNPVADPSGAFGEEFGGSAAMSGSFAIVGSRSDTAVGGCASIFQFNGSGWVFMQKLVDPTGAIGDNFGFSVSISGNYAIVGAPSDQIASNSYQGSACIFHYNGSNWIYFQKIFDPVGEAGDLLGQSVSISGNFAIIGSPLDDVGIPDQGSASIYFFSGTGWVFLQKLTDASANFNDQFGAGVSISGLYAVVGAPKDDGIHADQGSASFFRYNGSSWVFMQKFSDPGPISFQQFGASVSISGNYCVVGCSGENSNRGSVNFYSYDGTGWMWLQKFIDPLGDGDDYFGIAVSISEHYAIVGASWDDIGDNFRQGSATIYVRVGSGWQKLQLLNDPGGTTNGYFGQSVAIDGTTQRFLVGVPSFAYSSGKVVFGKVN